MNISYRSILTALLVAFLFGCGDNGSFFDRVQPGGQGTSPGTTTISGIISDDPVSGANVTVLSLDGNQLASATTDIEGRFSTGVADSDIAGGYRIQAAGGQIGNTDFVGELKAIYGPSEDRDMANATLVTTLVSELAELEEGGTLIDRRDAVLQLLGDIGLFASSDWNMENPGDVDLFALRSDIALLGFDPVMDGLVADLQDDELSADNMGYFPAAHGGITYLSLDVVDNVVSGFPGGVASGSVILFGAPDTQAYEFLVVDGPDGLEVDDDGHLAYVIQDSATENADIVFTIKAVNALTGKGRTLNGGIFVMPAEQFDLGTVGPDGGTLREPVNSVEVVVPQGSVEADVIFSLLRGRDVEGHLSLEVRANNEVGEVQIYLPDPEQLDRAVESAPETGQIRGNKVAPPGIAEAPSAATDYPDQQWREEWDWFYKSARIGQQVTVVGTDVNPLTLQRPTWRASAEVASTLSCTESLNWEELNPGESGAGQLGSKIPVLFVHGYTKRDWLKGIELGGGAGTWGDFPPRVGEVAPSAGEDAFFPCEFQWITHARFQVVAEDLRKSVELLAQKTGKEVHIVGHSFGGILARTYLQGLAESPIDDYARPVASLSTLGTPHSGIADSNPEEMYGAFFPDGQDGDLKFDFAGQLSAYQMGEDQLRGEGNKSAYGLKDEHGFIAASISSTSDEIGVENIYPFLDNLPVQVLIGLNTDPRVKESEGRFVVDGYTARDGDGLITLGGQRFHPSLAIGATPAALLTPETTDGSDIGLLGARVTEHILGAGEDVQADEVVSGEVVSLQPPRGFSHTSSIFSGGRSSRLSEAELECEKIEPVDEAVEDRESGCDFHDGFRYVRLWLKDTPSENVSTYYENPDDTTTSGVDISGSQVDVGGGAADIEMFVSVVTQSGVPLERLTAGNFSLQETISGEMRDAVINSVSLEASAGTAVVIAIDRSGSMGPSFNNDIVAAKAAARTFVANMKPGDQAAIIDFAGDVVVRQDFTRDKVQLLDAIDDVDVGVWNGTAAYDAAYEGVELAKEVFGSKAVILMTDGADLSSTQSIEDVTSHASSLGVPVYTIGLGVDAGSSEELALIQIADGSNAGANGSGYYSAPTATDLEALYGAILELLSNAYRVSWQSTGTSGDSVSVEILVTYRAAQGTFTDSFVATYTVP